MKNLMIIWLAFFFFECKKEDFSPLNKPYVLNEGESAAFVKGNSEIVLNLIKITDSRCPKDVVCVRAGEAIVKFGIILNGKKQTDIELCLQCDNLFSIPSSINVEDFDLTLLEVNPYPVSSNNSAEKSAKILVK